MLLLTSHWNWLESRGYEYDGDSQCLAECVLDELYKSGYVRKNELTSVVDECVRAIITLKDKRENALTQHLYRLYKEKVPKEVFDRARAEQKREIKSAKEADEFFNSLSIKEEER